MRALAMTGMVTASMIPTIISGSDMRATPPAFRMSAGTRSSAMTAPAPASSAILAWSGVTTSMMTPPLSIWARPFLVAQVDVSVMVCGFSGRARDWRPGGWPRGRRPFEPEGPTSPSDYRTRPGDFPSCPDRASGRAYAVALAPRARAMPSVERPAFQPAAATANWNVQRSTQRDHLELERSAVQREQIALVGTLTVPARRRAVTVVRRRAGRRFEGPGRPRRTRPAPAGTRARRVPPAGRASSTIASWWRRSGRGPRIPTGRGGRAVPRTARGVDHGAPDGQGTPAPRRDPRWRTPESWTMSRARRPVEARTRSSGPSSDPPAARAAPRRASPPALEERGRGRTGQRREAAPAAPPTSADERPDAPRHQGRRPA